MQKIIIVIINLCILNACIVNTSKSQEIEKSPLSYSTFIGGNMADRLNAIKMDKDGYIYIGGTTRSPDFPVTPGAYCTLYKGATDGFVVKIDLKANKILWATFIGGSNDDYLSDLAIDDEGNIYIIGNTLSHDFPVTDGAFNTSFNGSSMNSSQNHGDLYVAKLSNDGSKLIYSTFLGGKESESFESLTIDREGCAYVCASTSSPDYPVTKGSFDTTFNGCACYLGDIVVSKLNQNGSKLEYSFFLGGRKEETGKILRDSKGNLIIVGSTLSKNFPITNDALYKNLMNTDTTNFRSGGDLFITIIDPTGKSLLYSTYLGGSNGDWPNEIMIDKNDNLFITGITESPDFIITNNAYQKEKKGKKDAFILKFNLKQKRIEYSTFIGGAMTDAGTNISIDSNKNIVLTGNTLSSDFPVTNDALSKTYKGSNNGDWGGDYFISIFDSTLSKLVYSTYLGGTGDDYWPISMLDKNNNLFIGGSTKSPDFPVTTDAINNTYKGGNNFGGDAILIKLSIEALMSFPSRINKSDLSK